MRLAVCTLSAVLLSGCSWLGGVGNVSHGGGHGHHAKSSKYGYNGHYKARSQHGQHQYQAQQDPCQVFSPRAPIPQGCHPSQVTLGTAGGFPQQPNFGGGEYASQGYGSHAGVAHQQAANYQPRKKMRKPRWRGTMSLGAEKSSSGNLLDYDKAVGIDPVSGYNPQLYNEGRTTGSRAEGAIVNTTWTANDQASVIGGAVFTPNSYEESIKPDISFDDVHSTPIRLAAGAEYILTPKTTVFANAAYSHAEGNTGNAASINGTLYEHVATDFYIPDPVNEGSFLYDGTSISLGYRPNEEIARFSYDFTDMRRVDLEAGARHYLDPIVKTQGFKTLTPFVGASVGASHYNAVSFDLAPQEQLFYEDAYVNNEANFYTVTDPSSRVDLYDSQWVPSGQLNAGMEWQVTPKTALAFETGVRIEGARKYSNGERGDNNIAIPMTIRGSYNF